MKTGEHGRDARPRAGGDARPRASVGGSSDAARTPPDEPAARPYPVRKTLPHDVPLWIDPSSEVYFITINCRVRRTNQLCLPKIGDELLASAAFRHHEGHWFTHIFLLMPDHLHALLSFPRDGAGIQRTVTSWKGWTAKRCGVEWQRDFFEHRLRGDEGRDEKSAYIRANPVRAGLVNDEESWPWVLWADPRGGDLFERWGRDARPRASPDEPAARPDRDARPRASSGGEPTDEPAARPYREDAR